ncbi:hypothetical protein KI387_033167, partial [Taxus chinensis]
IVIFGEVSFVAQKRSCYKYSRLKRHLNRFMGLSSSSHHKNVERNPMSGVASSSSSQHQNVERNPFGGVASSSSSHCQYNPRLDSLHLSGFKNVEGLVLSGVVFSSSSQHQTSEPDPLSQSVEHDPFGGVASSSLFQHQTWEPDSLGGNVERDPFDGVVFSSSSQHQTSEPDPLSGNVERDPFGGVAFSSSSQHQNVERDPFSGVASSSSSHHQNVESNPMSGVASSSSSQHQTVERDPLGGSEAAVSSRLYDVFINHRGPDVKHALADLLYDSLKSTECRVFHDHRELELGDFFPSTIRNAIQSACVQIAIFSPTYADSPWCLAELALMLETNAVFIPVFYHVEPSDVRYPRKRIYAAAFHRHEEKKRHLNKINEWEAALYKASLSSGHVCGDDDDVWKLVRDIRSVVLREVRQKMPLYVAKYPVGLDEIVAKFDAYCQQKGEKVTGNVKIIGIFGTRGSGKTTLASELFNRKRSWYQGACFLSNVREGKMTSLQSKVLKDLFHEDHTFQNINEGTGYLINRLERSKLSLFIVLDDIDHINQFDALVSKENLNSKSLVLVTTHDERLLIQAGISLRYRMKEMSLDYSRYLFCWHAFHQPCPERGYEDLVESFVSECGGLPLSLQVIGGNLFSIHQQKGYWELSLKKVRKTLPTDIKQRIKISFDALDNDQKQIFMDIACFFVGMGKFKCMAVRIWEASGWNGEEGLQTLVDKCLVEMEPVFILGHNIEELYFRMHEHIRDFGREMADEMADGIKHPRRLWRPHHSLESVDLRNRLTRTTESVRCLYSFLDDSSGAQITYFMGNSDRQAGTSTLLLWMSIELSEQKQIASESFIPLEDVSNTAIPSWIPLENLQALEIINGNTARLWRKDKQGPVHLKELQLIDTVSFGEFRNSCSVFGRLQNLVLTGNGRSDGMLIEGSTLSQVLKLLINLKSLIFRHFRLTGKLDLSNNVDGFEVYMTTRMYRLEIIDIQFVKDVKKICISGQYCPSLKFLRLHFLADLIEVNLTRITALSSLEVDSCSVLTDLLGIADSRNLVNLSIGNCWAIKELPSLAPLHDLERITIDGCPNGQDIIGIENLQKLTYIYISEAFGRVLNCLAILSISIGRLERLPSAFTTVIARAATTLPAYYFFGINSFSEIHINDNGE